MEILNHVDKRISKDQLVELKDVICLSYQEIAELLDLTDRTLYLKKSGEVFSVSVSDHLYSLAYLYSSVYRAFMNKARADKWMRRPSKAFRNKTPLALCNTNIGMLAVEEELKRLKMGIY
ncbi:hypothetical protein CCY01nite_07870 [Chitinophaga cymbidii]|uniref:Antitoxin Xre/MbcA/ParS-like toxin-binding domain-containing protein n=2 Tax=Chitinophaga cymbidii TaxID=1096750 RepID=A0A512RFN5_9BACT|nr:hypothetical protein CCY01nite_07870 [Chitinophaga cymbidii]